MKKVLPIVSTVALIAAIAPNAIAGTATNEWKTGNTHKSYELTENGKFERQGKSSFSYTRNGNVVDKVTKDSLTVDGVVVLGAAEGSFFGTDFFVAGIGGDDFDISLISSSTTDRHGYSVIADASSSYKESGSFSLFETETSNTDFEIHTLSTDTGSPL